MSKKEWEEQLRWTLIEHQLFNTFPLSTETNEGVKLNENFLLLNTNSSTAYLNGVHFFNVENILLNSSSESFIELTNLLIKLRKEYQEINFTLHIFPNDKKLRIELQKYRKLSKEECEMKKIPFFPMKRLYFSLMVLSREEWKSLSPSLLPLCLFFLILHFNLFVNNVNIICK